MINYNQIAMEYFIAALIFILIMSIGAVLLRVALSEDKKKSDEPEFKPLAQRDRNTMGSSTVTSTSSTSSQVNTTKPPVVSKDTQDYLKRFKQVGETYRKSPIFEVTSEVPGTPSKNPAKGKVQDVKFFVSNLLAREDVKKYSYANIVESKFITTKNRKGQPALGYWRLKMNFAA